MNLNLEQIRACARGISQVREAGPGWELLRFTTSHLEHLSGVMREKEVDRAGCSAGIALAFETDSDRLYIDATVGKGARDACFIDVWTDERFTAIIGDTKPGNRIESEILFPRSSRRRHVTLYLPHTRAMTLSMVGMAEDAAFRPADRRPVLLTLGDSITQGMDSLHPSQTYAAVLARQLGMDLHNQGIGGAVFDSATLPTVPVPGVELITVAFGVNDWIRGRPPEAASSYLARILEQYPGVPVVVFEPVWYPHGDEVDRVPPEREIPFSAYRQGLRDVVRQFESIPFVPRDQLLPSASLTLLDGVHPNTLGQIIYGNNAARACSPLR